MYHNHKNCTKQLPLSNSKYSSADSGSGSCHFIPNLTRTMSPPSDHRHIFEANKTCRSLHLVGLLSWSWVNLGLLGEKEKRGRRGGSPPGSPSDSKDKDKDT